MVKKKPRTIAGTARTSLVSQSKRAALDEGPTRAVWTGVLSFGALHIPLAMHTATTKEGPDFVLLHKTDQSPIRHVRVCSREHKEIPFEEIVRGYEYATGAYVTISEDDFARVRGKQRRVISIESFTPREDIDPIFFSKSYLLEPTPKGDAAYQLLRDALQHTKTFGIVSYVLRNREQIGALGYSSKALTIYQLRHMEELADPSLLRLPTRTVHDTDDLELAIRLIRDGIQPFRPEAYENRHTQIMYQILRQKIVGRHVPRRRMPPEPTPTDAANIHEVLLATIKKREHARA